MDKTYAVANVSVEWLMKNLRHSIDLKDLDLAYMIERKIGVGGDREKRGLTPYYMNLADSILTDGIKDPICVYMHTLPTGEEEFSQGNGHHRLSWAIIACLEWVPVAFSFDGDYMHNEVTDTQEGEWWSNN